MKVLVIASYAPSLIAFRGDLLKAMTRQGHTVIAVAPEVSKIERELQAIGVESRSVKLARTGINPVLDVLSLLQLRSLMRGERPDLVFSYTAKPVIYGSFAARLAGSIPMYSMITGLGSSFLGTGLKQRLVGMIIRRLYKSALKGNAGAFFQNPDDLADFKRLGLIKPNAQTFVVNGSGVNTQEFEPTPVPVNPVFLLIGRIIADKGIREYAEAARAVRKVHPTSRFLLVGWFDSNPSGISEAEVGQWCDEGSIEYLGPVDDVRPLISRCRVYVLPSYREGLPRTVLEAMSMGRAIITTDAPGCRQTVQEGVNGFLVPVGDSKRLADAMIRIIREPGLAEKMGTASRRIVLEKYDVDRVNASVLAAMGM